MRSHILRIHLVEYERERQYADLLPKSFDSCIGRGPTTATREPDLHAVAGDRKFAGWERGVGR